LRKNYPGPLLVFLFAEGINHWRLAVSEGVKKVRAESGVNIEVPYVYAFTLGSKTERALEEELCGERVAQIMVPGEDALAPILQEVDERGSWARTKVLISVHLNERSTDSYSCATSVDGGTGCHNAGGQFLWTSLRLLDAARSRAKPENVCFMMMEPTQNEEGKHQPPDLQRFVGESADLDSVTFGAPPTSDVGYTPRARSAADAPSRRLGTKVWRLRYLISRRRCSPPWKTDFQRDVFFGQ